MIDVIVAGAGPAGASLAIQLVERGHRVVLVDRAEFPREKLCGEFLSPEASVHLRSLGLEVSGRAVPVERLRFAVAGARPLSHPLPEGGLGLRRIVLDRLLVETARERGADWMPGTRVVAVKRRTKEGPEPFRVEVLAEGHRSELEARVVVNATGRHGGLGAPARTGPSAVAFRRHYRWRRGNGAEHEVALFPFRGGYAGLGPVDGARANLCALCTLDRFRREAIRPAEWFERLARENAWLARALEDLEPESEDVMTTAGIPLGSPRRESDTLLEIGDAAGSIAPLVGDGISMALRSAELAAGALHEVLENRSTWKAGLRAYRRARRREFAARLGIARGLERVVRSRWGARVLVRTARGVPPLASWLIRRTRDRDRAVSRTEEARAGTGR